MRNLPKGEVETLFRRIRQQFFPAHVSSTQTLHDQLKAIKLSDFSDVELYLNAIDSIFLRLTDRGQGLPEEMMVSFIIGGLPRPEYNTFVLFSGESNTVNRISQKLLSYARSEPAIPGSLHPSALKDKAHSTREHGKKGDKGKKQGKDNVTTSPQEDCRNFAAGRCRFGDNCRFRHTQPPTAPAPSAQHPTAPTPTTVRQCSHCKKDGHTQESCFALHPTDFPGKPCIDLVNHAYR
jgi:hypothetical protein